MAPSIDVKPSQATMAPTLSPKKKRKMVHSSSALDMAAPSSFADTLKRLKEEADAVADATVDEETKWPRPSVDTIVAEEDDITFQQIDCEEHASPGSPPTVRIYGVTKKGNSVLVHVHSFLPYFYIAAPRGFRPADCQDLTNHLNSLFGSSSATAARAVEKTEMCAKKSLMEYRGDEDVAFIKITCGEIRALTRIRGSMERGEVGFRDIIVPGESILTYENIAYTLRFMIDNQVRARRRPTPDEVAMRTLMTNPLPHPAKRRSSE